MKILLCGANGLIGRAVEQELALSGHQIIRAVRQPVESTDIRVNFRQDTNVTVWINRLQGIDCVINAVGIFIEKQANDFDLIHRQTPIALFQACQIVGVKKVIQLSALAKQTSLPYLSSKLAADAMLLQTMPDQATILRLSMVYSPKAKSSKLFLALASMPISFVPRNSGLLQPIDLQDVAQAVVKIVNQPQAQGVINLVGTQSVSFRQLLTNYRQSMGLKTALTIAVPNWLMRLSTTVVGWFPNSIVNRQSWSLLQGGSYANSQPITNLLGRQPLAIKDFIAKPQGLILRMQTLASWRKTLFIAALTSIWLLTVLVCLIPTQIYSCIDLLKQVGFSQSIAHVLFYSSIFVNLFFAIATVVWQSARLWWVQIAVISFYSLVIAIFLPEYLTQPFAPIIKNIAIIAILLVLVAEEN